MPSAKVVIVGDPCVGKSCLLDSLCELNKVDWLAPDYDEQGRLARLCELNKVDWLDSGSSVKHTVSWTRCVTTPLCP